MHGVAQNQVGEADAIARVENTSIVALLTLPRGGTQGSVSGGTAEAVGDGSGGTRGGLHGPVTLFGPLDALGLPGHSGYRSRWLQGIAGFVGGFEGGGVIVELGAVERPLAVWVWEVRDAVRA
jgi:hypothetical protein